MDAEYREAAPLPVSVRLYVAGVSGLAALVLLALVLVQDDPGFERLGLMLAVAGVLTLESVFERSIVREAGQRESYGHEESFIVAMALLSSPLTVAVAFGAGVLAANVVRRPREPIKIVFNVAGLLASGGIALLVVVAIAGERPAGPGGAVAVLAGSAVFLLVNSASVSGVLALARATTFRRNLADDLGGKILVWSGNTAIGLLAGLAAAAHLWTLPFGLVAMFALHFALSGHERARGEQQKLADLVDSSSDGIFSVDPRGRIRSWNPACEAITSLPGSRVVGRRASDVLELLEAEREHPSDVAARLDPDRREPDRMRIRSAEGETRWLTVTRAPLPEGGSVVVLRDETTRRQADELIARQEHERLKSDLVAAVSHELRTPLTSILGFTKTLLARDLDEGSRRRSLEIVEREATRLGDLIDDLLDLRRLAEGRFIIARDRVDLGEIVSQQVAVFSAQSAAHDLVLELPADRLWVVGQRDRLTQVVSNLISNAIKYSPEGGEVRVTATPADGSVRVAVADPGLGIPPEQQGGIFTRFFRVDSPDRRAIAGSGLGLALAREIVEAHGGRMGFESAEGEGSTFWFELPAG